MTATTTLTATVVRCSTCGKPSLADALTDCPEHFALERSFHTRCPKCGSSEIMAAEDGWDSETATEHPFGIWCRSCDYWNADGEPQPEFPYIAPGDPGSHDQPEDYLPTAIP